MGAAVAAAPVPDDIQNILRSMWSCDAPNIAPRKGYHDGDHALPREISPGQASSIMEALAAPAAPTKHGKRGNIASLKVSALDETG